MREPWEHHRELLQEGIAKHLAEATEGSGQLVREQIEASDPAEYDLAALACLGAAEAAGGAADAALPAAVAIALCSQMGLVFGGLENAGGAASLSTAWGMPRSLNAGDALFALAQESLLAAPNELTTAIRLQAGAMLDSGVRGLVEALLAAKSDSAPGEAGQRALLPAALALGGLLSNAGAGAVEKLEALGRRWATLPEDELVRVLASDPSGWLAT